MKKILKIVMILIMISGIVFSISNFLSVNLNSSSSGLEGIYTYWPDGTVKDCEDIGKECPIGNIW